MGNIPQQTLDKIKAAEEMEKEFLATLFPDPEATEGIPEPEKEETPEVVEEKVELKEEAPTESRKETVPEETWEQKYKVLQGKYNKELPKTQGEISSLKEKIAYLEGVISSSKPKEEEVKKVDPEMEAFKETNPELWAAIDKLRGEDKKIISELQKKLESLEQVTVSTVQDKFTRTLKTNVPDWEEVAADPEFFNWLQVKDRFTSMKRYDLLSNAVKFQDVDATTAIYEEYKKTLQKEETPSKPNINKEEIVVPKTKGASAGTTPNKEPQKKIYTEEEILSFYRDKANGNRRKLSAKKILEMDTEYSLAIQEGRIQ